MPWPADLLCDYGAAGELVRLRRRGHSLPELALEEVETARLIAERLRYWGRQVTEGVGETGVISTLRGCEDGDRPSACVGHGRAGAPRAETLRAITRNGPGYLYDGPLGKTVVAAVRERGGCFVRDDLSRCRPQWQEPQAIEYRVANVYAPRRTVISSCSALSNLHERLSAVKIELAVIRKDQTSRRL